jgi:hypothetical protein
MPKHVSASNSAVSSVEHAAALYGVRCYRMNSRTFEVEGAGGRKRPMFMGAWKDELGQHHFTGMADLLLTPRVRLPIMDGSKFIDIATATIPLWVECKSGTGRLGPEQIAFRDDVVKAGAAYIEARDSAEAVIAWFDKMGVRR